MPFTTFNRQNFYALCRQVAATDADLLAIIKQHGYPPFWSRRPTFKTLIHFILEQQVSLASARAALAKLQSRLVKITPANLLLLTDEELKACYFSRQKIVYARLLAQAFISKQIVISQLINEPEEAIRLTLKKLKGIGDWTVDVFLMMCLHRCDVFAIGDVALIKSLKEVKNLPPATSKQEVLTIADRWQPYRTIAAYLLWHAYLQRRKKLG